MKAMLILTGAALAVSPAVADVFTDSASFMAQLEPGSYLNNFTGLPGGVSPDLNYSGNGFSYTVDAVGPGTQTLFNDPGLVSTDSATDAIRVTFTSGNVTAVGGNFWATDVSVSPVIATITINTSDGQSSSFSSLGPTSFRGFTSNSIITSIVIDALDADPVLGPFAWSTMDNLTVGRVIPAPGAMAVLGLGGLVATRRRR